MEMEDWVTACFGDILSRFRSLAQFPVPNNSFEWEYLLSKCLGVREDHTSPNETTLLTQLENCLWELLPLRHIQGQLMLSILEQLCLHCSLTPKMLEMWNEDFVKVNIEKDVHQKPLPAKQRISDVRRLLPDHKEYTFTYRKAFYRDRLQRYIRIPEALLESYHTIPSIWNTCFLCTFPWDLIPLSTTRAYLQPVTFRNLQQQQKERKEKEQKEQKKDMAVQVMALGFQRLHNKRKRSEDNTTPEIVEEPPSRLAEYVFELRELLLSKILPISTRFHRQCHQFKQRDDDSEMAVLLHFLFD